MIRRIIKIDQEKCNGCGACATACHEGAIDMVNGKAVLTREDYCDGLGDCLPNCPTGAITFEEREAPAYNEAAVKAAQGERAPVAPELRTDRGGSREAKQLQACGCPGEQAKTIAEPPSSTAQVTTVAPSELRQWPVQIKLVPVNAPFFDGAKLLIAADCTAYAYGNFHQEFIRGHVTLIGCPKLDAVDYSEKLAQIIAQNDIRSITVTRMEVPCCGGIEHAVKQALAKSGKLIPWQVVTISADGRILDRT